MMIAVAPGELATIVTRLEMRARPRPAPLPESPLRLVRWAAPKPAAYRALFTRVGARWLWFSRLTLDEAALAALLAEPGREVHVAVDRAGVELGLVELRHEGASTNITYFALVPELAGRGLGRWLMAETLARAWRRETSLVWLNTCTLDHPRALGFYRAQGFVAVRRTIETFPDPRHAGLLPPDCAPQVPLL
ncbi:MAG: GCN5 family acetyltransferase [Proteobacteria bacterium SG_bin5]|nr:GNAT family N-acetyltransferase [Sphingomonas sp.]OQW44491.1 MAG: GCN5 family acetyltransferase [Proteobacteria bacterium SG_bin5]